MDRRSFFKFLGFGAAAAPAVVEAVVAAPVAPLPIIPVPSVPTVPLGFGDLVPGRFQAPQGYYGSFCVTLTLPHDPYIGVERGDWRHVPWPSSQRLALERFDHEWDRFRASVKGTPEFYRDRHERKHLRQYRSTRMLEEFSRESKGG